jgi:hypothetical protein
MQATPRFIKDGSIDPGCDAEVGGAFFKKCPFCERGENIFNDDHTFWAGIIPAYNAAANGSAFSNGYFAQLRGGVKPVENWISWRPFLGLKPIRHR